jgi:DnaK suppressor protein
MDSRVIEELAAQLCRRRSSLLEGVSENWGTTILAGERGSEMEESAQIDRINRLRSQLNQRGQTLIREIETALERVAAGTYGLCRRCGEEIGLARLRALPTATLCIDCAKAIEKRRSGTLEDEDERLAVKHDALAGGSLREEEEL